MSRPLWFVRLLRKAFPSGIQFARATHLPILGSIVDHMLFAGDDLMYLPANGVVMINEPVANPDDVVVPSQVVDHFIERAGVHWIMDACICRTAERCRDYPVGLGCLFLGEAALGINPKLGRRVTKAEAHEHVARCRQAGLIHLIGRNKLDTVWLGVRPGERLLTVCNCCPCCCLWRVLPYVAPEIGAKITRMPGVEVSIGDDCQGCGTCAEQCFVKAIRMAEGRATITDACRGCGRCVQACPQGAIEMKIDADSFVEQAICRISPLVDVT